MKTQVEYFVFGLLFGAAAGLLLAPESGKGTRKFFRSAYDRSREARQIARDTADLARRARALGRPLAAGEI